jgi:hypothetical protein
MAVAWRATAPSQVRKVLGRGVVQELAPAGAECVDDVGHDGGEQRLERRDVPVEGAGPDAGALGGLVEGRARAVVLDHEGATGPADVAVVGDEQTSPVPSAATPTPA